MIRTFPSINSGNETNLQNIDLEERIIIQEKIDGSQFTVYKDESGKLHYYNKNKEIGGQGKPFLNAYLSLQGKEDMFQEGLFYHGEAMTSRLTNTNEYERAAKCFWIIYEIVRTNNYVLTPEEMQKVLQDTPFETVRLIYDNKRDEKRDLKELVENIMKKIDNGDNGEHEEETIKSCLGGIPEGIVLKALNVLKKDKFSVTRYKFVRPAFSEANHSKKKRLPQVSDTDFIFELGSIYNTDARFSKAVQHLQEKDKWNETNINRNISLLVGELDEDLLKEELEEIKTQLFIRYWPEISKAARQGLTDFLKK